MSGEKRGTVLNEQPGRSDVRRQASSWMDDLRGIGEVVGCCLKVESAQGAENNVIVAAE